MTDYNNIKSRLRTLVEKRDYYFKDTTRTEAEKYLASKTNFRGLTDTEIQDLEKRLARTFPDDFKQYLYEFGKNCGDLFCCGQDIQPEKFTDYQQWANELIEEQKIESFITDSSMVFYFHQGYVFGYFDKYGAIYQYVEGRDKPEKVYDTFSAMIEDEIKAMEEIHAKSKDSDGHFITINNGYKREFPSKNGIRPKECGDRFVTEE